LDTANKYLSAVPSVTIPKVTAMNNPGHSKSNADTAILDDSAAGGWLYTPLSGDNFLLEINCTHNDTRGVVWSAN
jgi:hypothetical protein